MLFRATRVNLREKCCEARLGPRFRPYPTTAECLDFFRCKTTGQVLLIAAAVSEPEASTRGSSLIGKKLGAFNHFFLPNARNCGYARLKDLGCAMDSQGIVVKCEWKI